MQKDNLRLNIVYSIFYQILILIIPLITTPYISRILGAERIGIYSYTQAFANYFVLFIMLGVNNYGNRRIAQVRDNKEKSSKRYISQNSFLLQFLLGITILFMYIFYILCLKKDDKIIYLLQIFYIISAVVDINWFFFGIEKFKLTVTRNIIIKLITLILIFCFVKEKSDLVCYTFIMTFGMLMSVTILWPFLFKYVTLKKIKVKDIFVHLKPNLILFIPVIAISLYNIMDKIMLGEMSSNSQVGFYANAEKIAQIPNSIIMAIGTVLMPRISNLVAKGNKEKSQELFKKSLTGMTVVSIIFALLLAKISKIFAPWFFGKEFTICGIYIMWLCPTIIFKSIAGAIRTQLIIPLNKDKIYIYSVCTGAGVNLLANFFLIPRYQGLGAVLGTIFAEGIVCLVQIILTISCFNYKYYFIDVFFYLVVAKVVDIILNLINFKENVVWVLFYLIFGFLFYGVLVMLYFILKNILRRK